MVALRDFLEPGTKNDVIIQQSLRDIDGEVLVVAFFGMAEDEKAMVLRNMSKRAQAMIMDDFHAKQEPSPETVKAALAHFLGLLDRHAADYVPGLYEKPTKAPETDFTSTDAIIASFVALDRYALANGFLSLEPCLEAMAEPLARKGIQMVTEGHDPLLIRSILDTYKEAYLRSLETRLDLIITGVESIAQKDSPHTAEMRLKALVARL